MLTLRKQSRKNVGRKNVTVSLIALVCMLAVFICPAAKADFVDRDQGQIVYAMSIDNTSVYTIDVVSGVVTTVSTSALHNSIAIAADQNYLYYWKASGREVSKYDLVTGTHSLVNTVDLSEENATIDNNGDLWVLDRTNSYDPLAPPAYFLGTTADNTGKLYDIDLSVAQNADPRSLDSTIPMSVMSGTTGFAVGDIAWGPDGKLYISTNNTFWSYDDASNYVWDPVSGTLEKKGGVYHAGLVWVGDKLYGSETLAGTSIGALFELNPDTFETVTKVAQMPSGVTIGDLAISKIPEPATISILAIGCAFLRKTIRKRK